MGKIRNAYKILVEIPHVRGLDGRFRQTLDCNVKVYHGEVGVALNSPDSV
jgi:hypothetical protein